MLGLLHPNIFGLRNYILNKRIIYEDLLRIVCMHTYLSWHSQNQINDFITLQLWSTRAGHSIHKENISSIGRHLIYWNCFHFKFWIPSYFWASGLLGLLIFNHAVMLWQKWTNSIFPSHFTYILMDFKLWWLTNIIWLLVQ